MRARNIAVGLAMTVLIAAAIMYVMMPRGGLLQYAVVSAQSAAAGNTSRDFASLPDWSGIWMQSSDQDAGDVLPYKPEWEAAYREFLDHVRSSQRYSFSTPLEVVARAQ